MDEAKILRGEIQKWAEIIKNIRPARDALVAGPICFNYDSTDDGDCPNCPLKELNQDAENDSSFLSQIVTVIREDKAVILTNSDRASLAEYEIVYPGLKKMCENYYTLLVEILEKKLRV